MRDALQNESSAGGSYMSVQLRLGTRKRIEFQGEGSEVAAGEVGPRKGRGREKEKNFAAFADHAGRRPQSPSVSA